MAGVAFETAEQVINDAAVELGLYATDSSDPFGSTNAGILMLCRLVTGVGRDLVKAHQWSHLVKRTTISTSNGDFQYDLADDFDRIVNGSGWNQTTDYPFQGPVSAQQWEALQALSVTGWVGTAFTIRNNEVWVYPTPGATANTLAYAYISSYWVKESGESAPNTTRCDDDDDTIHFEPRLFVAALKLAYLRANGFDTTAAERDYQTRFAQAAGSDGASPVLSLVPRSGEKLIDGSNVPDTGVGS